MKNTGKPYELLTQQVFARLLAQPEGVCANVERDVALVGKGTTHKVDVTFEFIVGPIKYRTIVQCKDWASAVKQEQVFAFQSVLSDIPGQPRGIIVSRSGFQEGARTFARLHGIELYELREPRDEDWEGLYRTVNIKLMVQSPRFEVRYVLDEEWIRQEGIRLGLSSGTSVSINPSVAALVTDSGEKCDLRHVLRPHIPPQLGESAYVHHRFEERTFLESPQSPIPRLLVSGVDATITLHIDERDIQLNLDHLVAYCFRDVLGGTIRFLGSDGGPAGGDVSPSGRRC
jgi:hypothetical protein